MKQCGVGEHAVETLIRQIELEKILLPHVAAAVGTRHVDEARGAIQSYRDVTESSKHLEVASWSAAEIQYRERRSPLDVLQQCRNVLADVVILRAFVKILGIPVVVFQREAGDFLQFWRIQFHIGCNHVPTFQARTERSRTLK